MKLSDCIMDAPLSGECKINVDKVVKCFGFSSITKLSSNEYRLYNPRAGIKITISEKDALDLIEKLKLVPIESPIFSNTTTFVVNR